MKKTLIRKNTLEKRGNLVINQHKSFSNTILNRLLDSQPYKDAKTIMTFVSFKDEVDTHNFIKQALIDGKNILVPITIPETKELKVSKVNDFYELEPGFYNILTPKEEFIRYRDPKEIDLILVPGVTFDREGYRVGYGGGYYDRFLSKLENVTTIGIAFDLQVEDRVPREPFDIPVDFIYTEKEIIICK